MKVKQDGVGNTSYLPGRDSHGRSYYATRVKSDGRDAVMMRMPDGLYTGIAKNAEGVVPDYVLDGVAFNYACHFKGAHSAAADTGSTHPEYRFLARSGRTAHVVIGQDKTIVVIWIESPSWRKGENVSKL